MTAQKYKVPDVQRQVQNNESWNTTTTQLKRQDQAKNFKMPEQKAVGLLCFCSYLIIGFSSNSGTCQAPAGSNDPQERQVSPQVHKPETQCQSARTEETRWEMKSFQNQQNNPSCVLYILFCLFYSFFFLELPWPGWLNLHQYISPRNIWSQSDGAVWWVIAASLMTTRCHTTARWRRDAAINMSQRGLFELRVG